MTTPSAQAAAERDTIIGSLATSLQLSEDLLAALHEEGTALRAMDTQGLFRISRRKEALLAKIHYLDDAIKHAWTTHGQGRPGLDTPTEEIRHIAQYQQRINSTRQEIQAKNSVNKRFTEDTLSCLSDAIALLTQPPQNENTYRVPGRSQARPRTLPSCISCAA